MTTETRPSFTPGPWHHEQKPLWPHDVVVFANDGYTVARWAMEKFNREEDNEGDRAVREYTEANARLIAAAPEMYEALRDLKAAYVDHLRNEQSHARGDDEIADRARAALAKADGSKAAHLHDRWQYDEHCEACEIEAREEDAKGSGPRVTCFCGGKHVTGWCLSKADGR